MLPKEVYLHNILCQVHLFDPFDPLVPAKEKDCVDINVGYTYMIVH